MGTKTFNNYESLLTFTRASKGHALRPVSYGTELVSNGDFSDGLNNWTDNSQGSNTSEISVVNGQLNVTCVGGDTAWAYQIINLKVGALYQISYDVIQTQGGNIHVYLGASAGGGDSYQKLASVGSHTDSFVADDATSYLNIREFSAGTSIIDNLSIKEVTFDQPDGTLTLFEHPNNVPRVEYDADRNRLGLLVEEARTNLFARSDAKEWAVSGGGTTTINTDLTLGAFTGAIRASGGQDWHRMYAPYFSVTSGTTYTITAFFKYGTSNNVLLNFRDTAGSQESRIIGSAGNLTNNLANAGTVTILQEEALPNAVRKVVVKYVPDFSGSFEFGIGPNSTTSGETVIPLAAQCEQASFGTSYIKTTGSTATRAVDIATLSFDNFGHNKKEMTLLVDFDYRNWQHTSQFPRAIGLGRSTTSTNANFGVFNDGGNSGTLRYRVDNSSGAAVLGAANLSGSDGVTSAKVALAVKEGQHAITYNGNTPSTSTGGDPELETVDILAIGARWGEAPQATADYANGHIKSIKYYPRRLTDAQLQELTS